MSLIKVRGERKELAGSNPARPQRLWKLVLLLAAVLYLIWYLGRLS
jgi:hypothetical protein